MFKKDLERLSSAETRGEFIGNIYEGSTVSEVCAAMSLNPGALAVYCKSDLDFKQDIRDAQAFRVDMMVDKLENIQDYEDNPLMAKVISGNIQWLAAKRYREIYGDKVDVQVNHIININDAMAEAKNRTLQFIDANALEHKDTSTDSVSVALPVIDIIDEIDPLS